MMEAKNLSFITFETTKTPEFKQVRGKDWIYWGENNSYPDYLIDLYMRSSTHNAIVTGKVNYILGNGWTVEKRGLSLEDQAIASKFINTINPNQTLDELSEELFLDFELFNAIAIEVIWNKAKSDFDLHHVPLNKLRTNEDESVYYYSKDWSVINQSEEKTGLKEYKPFDFDKKENGIYIYKITAPRKGKDPNVYPMPEYIGSTQAIETDVECSNYNLSEIKTGFSAGTLINFFNGVPEAEQKIALEKQIRNKFTGTDRAGSLIINWTDGRDRGSEVTSLAGNDLDKRYIELKKDVRQEIFTGHKVSSPMLFGVKTEGQLGGRSEIIDADELFQNSYVSIRQNKLESVFNKFAKLKNLPAKLKLSKRQSVSNDIFTEQTIVNSLPAKAIQEIIADRMGVDLTRYQNNGVVTQTQSNQKMYVENLENRLMDAFGKVGRSREMFEIIRTKECFFNTREELLESELQCFEDEGEGGIITTSPINNAPKINVEVLYSYELRDNAPKLSPGGTSRPFCKNLIALDKLYTRAEIDRLTNEFGTDVWKYKGGWYTNPNTGAPTPQCRHIWKQNLVKRK